MQPTFESQVQRRRLGLLRRILRGGSQTAAARACIFGTLSWEKPGKRTKRLSMFREDVKELYRMHPRLGEEKFAAASAQEHLGTLAGAPAKTLNKVLRYKASTDKKDDEARKDICELTHEQQLALPLCPFCNQRFWQISRCRIGPNVHNSLSILPEYRAHLLLRCSRHKTTDRYLPIACCYP